MAIQKIDLAAFERTFVLVQKAKTADGSDVFTWIYEVSKINCEKFF